MPERPAPTIRTSTCSVSRGFLDPLDRGAAATVVIAGSVSTSSRIRQHLVEKVDTMYPLHRGDLTSAKRCALRARAPGAEGERRRPRARDPRDSRAPPGKAVPERD